MASTVIDLALNLRTAMNGYAVCQLWIFIQSDEWKAFQAGCEDLMAFLEFSGHPLTASRVFQGLTDIHKAMHEGDKDTWLEECYGVQQRINTLLMRLNAISRSWNQLCPDSNTTSALPAMTLSDPAKVTDQFSLPNAQQQPRQNQSGNYCQIPQTDPASVTPKTLSATVQAAWRQYQMGLARGKFEKNPPNDRDVYDWVLYHLRLGDQMVCFDTWQRYLRTARKHNGCQKNTPRKGRPHGSSVIRLQEL